MSNKLELGALYEGLQISAQENREQRAREEKEKWNEYIIKKQEETSAKLSLIMGNVAKRIDEDNRAEMEEKINKAKEMAESEIRSQYEDAKGSREWNESESNKAWKNMLSNLNE